MAEEAQQAPAAPEVEQAEQSQEQIPAQEEQTQQTEEQVKLESLKAKEEAGKKLSKTEKKMIKSLKLKIDGQEYDETLPFEIEDDPEKVDWMRKNLQMSKVAQKRMQSEAQLQKEVRAFVEELRKNPRKVLSDPNIGVDLKEIAKQIIEEEIANSQKSPEQLEREKLEAELKAIRSEREKEKEEAKARELERLQQQELERYDNQITNALSKSTLPKSPYVVKKMADYMLLALENNVDLSADEIIPVVEQEIKDELKQMFAALPEDAIESIVGKDVITKVRKKSIAKAAPPTPLKSAVKDVASDKKEKKEEVKMNYKDFFKI